MVLKYRNPFKLYMMDLLPREIQEITPVQMDQVIKDGEIFQNLFKVCIICVYCLKWVLETPMKGIKANRKKVTNGKPDDGWGKDGKWHIPIQPTDNKRPQDVIDIDSQEGPPKYRPH
jgi:hypothetical protein